MSAWIQVFCKDKITKLVKKDLMSQGFKSFHEVIELTGDAANFESYEHFSQRFDIVDSSNISNGCKILHPSLGERSIFTKQNQFKLCREETEEAIEELDFLAKQAGASKHIEKINFIHQFLLDITNVLAFQLAFKDLETLIFPSILITSVHLAFQYNGIVRDDYGRWFILHQRSREISIFEEQSCLC